MPESSNICSESTTGTWRKSRFAPSFADACTIARDISGGFTITSFALLVHGNTGGRFIIGPDVIDPASVSRYAPQFNELSRLLAPQADIFIFGCVSGLQEGGSVLLKEISKLLPGRRVIGFNIFNSVNPANQRRDKDRRACYEPDVWCSGVSNSLDAKDAQFKGKGASMFANPAIDSAPQAKIARDGAIIKWPADENPKKHDARLQDVIERYGGKRKR